MTFKNLLPNNYYYFDIKLDYENSEESVILTDKLFTKSFKADYDVIHEGPTSYTLEIDMPAEDKVDGGKFEGKWHNYEGETLVLSRSGLDPDRSYDESFYVKYQSPKPKSYWTESSKANIRTDKLTWEEGRADALSKTRARIMNETNCDAYENTGIEWRRVDAPDVVKSSIASCPVVDGMLVGVLDNLNPDVYYKYRPFYTSSTDKTYYGEWVGIFTGDAGVVFKPEVRTGKCESRSGNSVSLSGSVVPGTDNVTEQGFEWWQTDGPARISGAGQTRGTIKADGIRMEAELSDLKYATSYTFRAYAKTDNETYYGNEMTFTTDEPSGIEDVFAMPQGRITLSLKENPVRSTGWVKIYGCDSPTVHIFVTSISGARVFSQDIDVDGNWQAVDFNLASGLYLLTATTPDGRHDTIRLIIR